MAITATKTSDVIRVVHVDDPDVDAHDSTALGWVVMTAADVSPGATCLGVAPCSKRELMLADGDMTSGGLNAGAASYHLAVAGLRELGTWTGERLAWSKASRSQAEDFVESVSDSGAIWQLGGLVRKLSQGWTPADDGGDVVPLGRVAGAAGQSTDG